LYSNLRFVISASVVGCAGLIGVLALLPATLEDRLLASAELSAPAARACKQQNWFNLDRTCLTRRGMPWVAASPASDAAQAASSAETSPDQVLSETPSSAAVAKEAAQPDEVTGSRQETATAPIAEEPGPTTQTSEAAPPPQEATLPQQAAITPPQEPITPDVAAPPQDGISPAAPQPEQVASQQEPAAPQLEPAASQQEASAPAVSGEPQHTTKRRSVTPVRHVAPAAPATVEHRRAAKANVDAQPRPPVGKTMAREDRGAKPAASEAVETQSRPARAKTVARGNRGTKPANEALNAVRRFQDNLRDIPVSSYAADGTPRTIVIRPTSIQDVYYYSGPR